MNGHGWAYAALMIRDSMTRVSIHEREPAQEGADARKERLAALGGAQTSLRYWLRWARDEALAVLAELPPEVPPVAGRAEGDVPPLPPPPVHDGRAAGFISREGQALG